MDTKGHEAQTSPNQSNHGWTRINTDEGAQPAGDFQLSTFNSQLRHPSHHRFHVHRHVTDPMTARGDQGVFHRMGDVVARADGQVAIHPDDAPLVRARLGESLTHSGWQIVEDVTLSRGGCRLECPAGDIDGSVEHRWQRLMETLGQNGNWIKSIPE